MMMSKDQIKMLRFQESKVISTGSEDDESSASSSQSSDEEDRAPNTELTEVKFFRDSIIGSEDTGYV